MSEAKRDGHVLQSSVKQEAKLSLR